MMYNWGLLLLGIIQIGTAVMIFVSVYNATLFGITTLPRSFSHYRYMLTALWISVGSIFVVGSFYQAIAPGAVFLAVVNAAFEITGYWMGVFDRLVPAWYAVLSTFGVGGASILSVLYFYGMILK